MSHVYVTSDWHIGHSGIWHKFRTRYASDAEHDYDILGRALGTVTKRDVLFVLGDVTWTQKGLETIDSMKFPCKLIMIGGNHDTLSAADYLSVFDEMYGAYYYKGCWLTHIPIHESELRGKRNVHGHCHAGGPNNHQLGEYWYVYYNAILEYNNYTPTNFQEVLQKLKEQKETVYDPNHSSRNRVPLNSSSTSSSKSSDT